MIMNTNEYACGIYVNNEYALHTELVVFLHCMVMHCYMLFAIF